MWFALTLHSVINVFSDAYNNHWTVGFDGEAPVLYKTERRLSEHDLLKVSRDTAVDTSRANLTAAKPHQPHYELNGEDPTIAKYFLEVFSGIVVLLFKAHQGGAIVYTLSKHNGKKDYILHKTTSKEIARLASSPNCIGVWFGMPCETSSAIRRPNKKGPPPLRKWNYLMRPREKLTNDRWHQSMSANRILNAMVKFIKTRTEHYTRWYIEHGRGSDLWRCGQIKGRMAPKDERLSQFDYCQFGTPYMKPSKMLSLRNEHFELRQKQCGMSPSNNYRRTATGQRHKKLINKNSKG